jgi:hypothetical protein
MCDFNKQDVLIIAKTILEDPIEYYESDYGAYYSCRFCNAETDGLINNDRENFKHEITCPVLIARDILTRNIKEMKKFE